MDGPTMDPNDPFDLPADSGEDAGGVQQPETSDYLPESHQDEFGGTLQTPEDTIDVDRQVVIEGHADPSTGSVGGKLRVPEKLGPAALVFVGVLLSALIWAALSAVAGAVAMVVVVAFGVWLIKRAG